MVLGYQALMHNNNLPTVATLPKVINYLSYSQVGPRGVTFCLVSRVPANSFLASSLPD